MKISTDTEIKISKYFALMQQLDPKPMGYLLYNLPISYRIVCALIKLVTKMKGHHTNHIIKLWLVVMINKLQWTSDEPFDQARKTKKTKKEQRWLLWAKMVKVPQYKHNYYSLYFYNKSLKLSQIDKNFIQRHKK